MPTIISGSKALRLAARDSLNSITGPRRLVPSDDVMGSSRLSRFGSYLWIHDPGLAFGVGRHGREAGKHLNLLAHLGKDPRFCEPGDVVSHGECAKRAPALCVISPLENTYGVKTWLSLV